VRCPRARRLWIEGDLTGAANPVLAEHLAQCGACGAWVVAARRLDEDLRALGALQAPDPIEVRQRVMARIAGLQPAGDEPRGWGLAWSGAGAAAAAGGLALGLAGQIPASARLLRGTRLALLELRPAAEALLEALARLAAAGLSVLGDLAGALPAALGPSPLATLLAFELAAGSVIVIWTITSVVGRDLRRCRASDPKEPRA
jgi:hypothetical protein